MAIRVGVFGAGGRMGATVCAAVAADPDLDLVAAVDPTYEGAETAGGVVISGAPRALADAHAEVAVAPGVGYGEDGEGFVRIAMVENEQRLRQAARNIKRYLQSMGVNSSAA